MHFVQFFVFISNIPSKLPEVVLVSLFLYVYQFPHTMSVDFSIWTIIYYFIVVVFGIVILMEKKHPVKALAYIAAVFFIPFVGIILYLIFGRDYRKRKLYSRKGMIDEKQIAQWKENNILQKIIEGDASLQLLKPFDKVAKMLWSDDKSILSTANIVDILINGEGAFSRIFEDLEAAKNHIHLEYFTIEEGNIADKLADILIRKVSQGVTVRVIYDDIGSRKLSTSYVKRLRLGGVSIFPFMPVRFIRFTDKINYRDHRKIVIIDGKIAYTGGINISDRYINNANSRIYWRDTHVRIVGAAVHSIQLRFMLNWQFVSGTTCNMDLSYFPAITPFAGIPMQVVSSGPDSDQPTMADMYALACSLAQRKISICTPYFVPPETIQRALISAALSGIEVEIIIPQKSDSKILDQANYSYIEEMLHAGVNIYLYTKGFIHAKTLVVDDFFSTIGTTNLDYRSFDIDFEINAVFYDFTIASSLMEDFRSDKRDSIQLDYTQWKSRPFMHRFKESVARLLGPVL